MSNSAQIDHNGRVVRAWCLEPGEHGTEASAERWLAVAAALSAWSGPPVTVERRLVVPGEQGLVDELLVAGADGADLLAPARELWSELAMLARPLLDTAAVMVDAARLAPHGYMAELRCATCGVASQYAPELTLVAALAALVTGAGSGSLGVALGSPLIVGPDPEAKLPDQPGVRLRVRLEGELGLPDVALANAAALAGARSDAGPVAWSRPHGPRASAAARYAIGTGSLDPWPQSGADALDEPPLVPVGVAAALVAIPIPTAQRLHRGERGVSGTGQGRCPNFTHDRSNPSVSRSKS